MYYLCACVCVYVHIVQGAHVMNAGMLRENNQCPDPSLFTLFPRDGVSHCLELRGSQQSPAMLLHLFPDDAQVMLTCVAMLNLLHKNWNQVLLCHLQVFLPVNSLPSPSKHSQLPCHIKSHFSFSMLAWHFVTLSGYLRLTIWGGRIYFVLWI